MNRASRKFAEHEGHRYGADDLKCKIDAIRLAADQGDAEQVRSLSEQLDTQIDAFIEQAVDDSGGFE